MRKIGAMKLHRLLACMLALVMGLTVLPAAAATLGGWENISVSVLYTDAYGQSGIAQAVQIPAEQGVGYGWWATLPAEAMGTTVTVQIMHPDPAYTYWMPGLSGVEAPSLYWISDKDADSVDSMYAYPLGYSYAGTVQVETMEDYMYLFLSTMEPPFAYEEAGSYAGGAELIVPGGDEGFGETPGAELIVPSGGSQGNAAAPEETTAVVTVYYKHVNGQTLDVQDVTLTGEGPHTLWPESSKVGGLNLAGEYSATVHVYAGGATDVASVTFLYEDAYVEPVEPVLPVVPATATIEVHYYHQDGYELDMQTRTLTAGSHTITPESGLTGGYELISDDAVVVYVDESGWTDVASISFIYRNAYAEPVTGEVTVMYILEDGTRIDTQTITMTPGYQTVFPESYQVDGLTLVSDASVNVYVDDSGAVSPNPVQFVYRQPVQQPAQATVTVFIFDSYGNEIAPRQQHILAEGSHVIEAPAGNAMPGYELISEAVLTVTVHADGSYTPSGEELSFWYREAQEEVEQIVPVVTEAPSGQMASITLRYLDSRGYAIADEQTMTLGNGTHTITPDYAHVPAGYTVMPGTESQTVTVRSGRANLTTVSFYFEQSYAAPAVYDVTVYYYDTMGREIAPRQTLQLSPGTHWVQANPQNLQAGYTLASESAFQLTVSENGSLDRAAEDVGFWYSQAPVEVRKAVITVRYVDGSGRTIAGPFTQELEGGQSYLISPDASAVPQAYDVSAADPVTVTVSAEGNASPAVVSFVAELRRESVSLPVGEPLNRYGVVNNKNVALRSEPYTTKSNTVLARCQNGDIVYMIASEYNQSGEVWTQIIVNGRTGYMKTEFIDALTRQASDTYAASVGATPVPTFTPAPTPEPTESFVEYITPVPVTPAPYKGYALLRAETALRTGTGSSEMTISWLPGESLVIVNHEAANSYTGESWSYVRTMDNLTGYVPTASLRQITEYEASWYLQQYATPAPTVLITNTPEPMQLQGYGLTTSGSVPLRRMASEQSRIVDNLAYGTVVYITGQTYTDGVTWQNVAVNGESGYIRSDLVRLMTEREETDYLNSFYNSTPTPSITPTSNPYNENGLSSFGYVTTDKVNFRAGASTATQKLATLNTYAMATVLGTERVNGTTWYYVTCNGQTGYIHGSYFHQMTLKEFSDFYGSEEYYQGLRGNGGSDEDDGYTGVGGQVSQEDQIVDDWYASGNVIQPSFAPFIPVGTVEPINPTATPTLEPLPGYVTQVTKQPTPTPVTAGGAGWGAADSDLPLPGGTSSVTYPMKDNGGNGGALVWIIVILLLLLAVGAAVVFMQHQRKRQQMALKAAQRRAQQARNANGGGGAGRPYARQSGAQSRTGAYPSYGQPQQPPLFQQPESADPYAAPYADPYAAPQAPAADQVPQRPYARTAGGEVNPQQNVVPRRVGRRTAWQQAHPEQPSDQDEA